LSNPKVIDDLKAKPEKTLKKLEGEAVAQLPYTLPPPELPILTRSGSLSCAHSLSCCFMPRTRSARVFP
jgi:hypothetical protein